MMMKRYFLISVLFLIFLAVLAAGCTFPSGGDKVVPPVSPTVTQGGPVSCGFTTCHGLDLTCGTNPPQMCTMQYELGDKCRQYAACNSSGGTCQLIKTPQFEACKSCVAKCGGGDPAEIFTCEEKC